MGRFRAVLIIPLLLLLLVFEFSSSLNDEGKVLLRLKGFVVDGPSDHLSSWIDGKVQDENPCGWFGVGCENGKVVSLNLEEFCLTGKFAPLFADLVHLHSLFFRCYQFPCSIPAGLQGTKIRSEPHFSNLIAPDISSRVTRVVTARKLLLKESKDGTYQDFPHYMPLPPTGNFTLKPQWKTPAPPESSLPAPSKPKIPASVPTSPPLYNKSKHVHNSTTGHAKRKIILCSVIGVTAGLAFIILIFVVYQRCNKVAVKPWATGLSGQLQKALVTGVPVLKHREIEAACEDFSNILGFLKDCILYKGTLSSGVEIAVVSSVVKSSKDWSEHDENWFKQKIATLSKVNHKNFVNLLGYCAQEEPFARMMVFEYAPNGTLYDHLHNKEIESLNWSTRLRIAMGIAYCLDHMHQLSPPIVLRNIDSISIHLTDDYAAKIADMELWSETTTSDEESGELHSKPNLMEEQASIVYKYGLILLEIVSGKNPTNDTCTEFNEWISELLKGEKVLKDIVDPALESFQEEDAKRIMDVIRSCLSPDPNARPKMKEVAGRLREITAVHPEGATPRLSPLWWAELEIISTEAN